MTQPDTLLICSETDDLTDLQPVFEQAAAQHFPGLKIALWSSQHGLGDTAPEQVLAMAGWFPPRGLPARLPSLRLIASIGAGVEHLLRDTTLPANVPITRIVDAEQAQGMAEYVLWAALYYHRGLDQTQQQQRRGEWRMPAQRPAAHTHVGIMGLGAMGAEVARQLAAHGFTVSGWSRSERTLPGIRTYATSAQLDDFLRPLDMVVSLLPLTADTHGLCNADWFAKLKPGACFVNCGRGEQVVVPDLLAALDSGHLRGAVLDVFDNEPLPPEHPLWHAPGVVVTPHMASSASAQTIATQIVENAARLWRGEAAVHTIDRTLGY